MEIDASYGYWEFCLHKTSATVCPSPGQARPHKDRASAGILGKTVAPTGLRT